MTEPEPPLTPKEMENYKRKYIRNNPIKLEMVFPPELTAQIVTHARISGTPPIQWVKEVVELYLLEHRHPARTFTPGEEHYTERSGDDGAEIYHL